MSFNVEKLPFTDLRGTSDKVYHIILDNFPANRFDDKLTLTIAEKDNCSKKCEFEFSVIGYCYEMINNGGIAALGLSTEKQQDMKYFLNSLCYYNTYANKYFQNHQYIKDNETNK